MSGSQIRKLYLARFESLKRRQLPFMEQLQHKKTEQERQRWGLRFLKPHQLKWLTSGETLRQQTSLSLKDRCGHFKKEFKDAHVNPTLLRQVYRLHGIKKKKFRWYKQAPGMTEEERRRDIGRMKR